MRKKSYKATGSVGMTGPLMDVASAGMSMQEDLLRDSTLTPEERGGIEAARDKMRQKMLELIPSLPSADLRKMVELNPALRRRIVDRMMLDPKGSNVHFTGKKEAGQSVVRANTEWTRQNVIDEMTLLASEDPAEFVRVMERTAGTKKQNSAAVDEVFQKSIATFLENAPPEADPHAPFRKMVTTLYSEPRATLLEWGTLAVRQGLDQNESQASLMAAHLAEKSRLLQDLRPGENKLSQNSLIDAALWVVMLGCSWATSGFPMLRPTHKLAAALMASGMPRELVPEVAIPWPTFAVLIPDGMLPMTEVTGSLKFVGLMPTREDSEWGSERSGGGYIVWAADADNTLLWTWRASVLADLMAPDPMEGEKAEALAVRELLGRLLIGALIEMDNPERRALIEQGPPRGPGSSSKREKASSVDVGVPAATWAFELRRDIKVDLRPWVRQYVAGGGKTASVRVLVRGHHRRQVCGVGRLERKWIHIEPFWRGSLDGPIAVRGHRIDVEESEAKK